MPEKLVTVKLSGSLFSSPDFGRMTRTIQNIVTKDKDLYLVLVAGGGATARKYIEAGHRLELDQATLDVLGIESSRLNARLLIEGFAQVASDKIPTNLSQAVEEMELIRSSSSKKKKILVCGGLQPGQSTNAVGAIIAEATRAKEFVNATDVDGVYDKDPRKFFDAVRLHKVTVGDLYRILGNESVEAGTYDLMDPVALRLISRSKIPTRIVKCESEVLENVLTGGKELGTEIAF